MAHNDSNLRAFIRQIISENVDIPNTLQEMQKGKQFDSYLELTLHNLTPDVPEGKLNNINVMMEVSRQLKTKLDIVFLKDFNYNNFYIIKLGAFVIKTNDGIEQISFKKSGEEDKRYSYPYLYVYHNKAEVIRFGSRFFESDQIILNSANDFIKNHGIKLQAKTLEPGKIEIITDFDTNNVIDLIDYSKISRAPSPKKDVSPKVKNEYRTGEPFMHNLYGKGKIVKTKKFGNDENGNPVYNVTVDFNGKMKTFRLSKKQKEMAE